jgi:tripartite-type tricarboxylate transporter receptor subunit TctC
MDRCATRLIAGLTIPLTIALAIALASVAVAGRALAQDWPAKPVRVLVGYPPGGATDTLARTVSTRFADRLGQPFIIENRPGATGSIAADAAARATPDGYTLLFGATGDMTIVVNVNPKLAYMPAKDFAPIGRVARFPLVLVVHPSLPAKSVKELLGLAKARPGQLVFASFGNASTSHLAFEQLRQRAAIDAIHAPYKGSVQAVSDLVGGHVHAFFDTLVASLPQVRAGRLRALAIASAQRSALLPDLPTVAEAGVPGFEAGAWVGLLAPARTPQTVINRLATELAAMLKTQELRETLARLGAEPINETPEQFAEALPREIDAMRRIVREAGIKAD